MEERRSHVGRTALEKRRHISRLGPAQSFSQDASRDMPNVMAAQTSWSLRIQKFTTHMLRHMSHALEPIHSAVLAVLT